MVAPAPGTILSSSAAVPIGRCRPSAFGIYTAWRAGPDTRPDAPGRAHLAVALPARFHTPSRSLHPPTSPPPVSARRSCRPRVPPSNDGADLAGLSTLRFENRHGGFSSRGRNEPRGEPLLEARSLFKSLSFQSVMDGTRKKHADFIHLIVALGEIPAKIQRRPLAGIKPRPLDVRRNAGQAILAERTR